MSVITGKTGLSSILKTYMPTEREKAKNAIINKVRFTMPKQKGIAELVSEVCDHNNYQPMNDYVNFLREASLSDEEFIEAMEAARKKSYQLSPKFTNLVEALLALPWLKRCPAAVEAYSSFFIDIVVSHNRYVNFGISKLIGQWIPAENDADSWTQGRPVAEKQRELQAIHKLLDMLVSVIPMTFDVILEKAEVMFPYFKKPTHVIAGFLHNLLWLVEYKPIFSEHVFDLVLRKMILLDVHAPRQAIEEQDDEDEDEEEALTAANCEREEEIFEMDDCEADNAEDTPMTHPIANTLDICMEKLYSFIESMWLNHQKLPTPTTSPTDPTVFFKLLLSKFDQIVLTCHNTHHVQFLLFYYCSFKPEYVDTFLASLWDKVKDPNVCAVIRQAAVCYIGSFLARSRSVPIDTLKYYLKEMCNWAHKYVQQADQCNGSLKANLVFYTICQSVFYVIAFRSRDLTADKQSLRFLQSLQLSGLVVCHLNPLRVCVPDVATIFAGVTRTYQLAYCHAIMESNARRKLATVYGHDTRMPEETLETFFPFDPYLLKMSSKRITASYLQYRPSEAEENSTQLAASHKSRKRGDSEMLEDYELDDFIIADKRQKLADLARSQEREAQFTYGLSPGFHP